MIDRNPQYEALQVAIVQQSMVDYINAIVQKKQLEKKIFTCDVMIKDCESFFKSGWCNTLTGGVNPAEIIAIGKHRAEYAFWKKEHGCEKCKNNFCIHVRGEHFTSTVDGKWKCEGKKTNGTRKEL